MEIHDERIGDTWVLTASGQLDGNTSADFADRDGGLIESPKPELLIDFTGIGFVTSAGVWAVLLLNKKIKSAGGSLALCSVCDSLREALDVISIHPTRAEAIAALRD